ncbi:NADPH oxidase 4-like isoform X2 [Uloborus diversus]|uniref:NADPH oxidase 4-like isoform X2 n=1 Tax=Uloborus diversus TaxID=327109 RepID=UPI00240A8E8B|nr:NADPH oxidase 4-like isoform X2 [Uloborus diversus]
MFRGVLLLLRRHSLLISLLLSRASASVINISCFMVIIPVCRSFITYIRVFGSKISAKCVLNWIDASKKFHIICAFTILFAGYFHTIAHVVNAFNFSSHYNKNFRDINAANFQGEDPLNLITGSVPGITGILMVIILFILTAAAVRPMRNISYDLFLITHHLFIIFLILLLIHPMSGILKEQVNVNTHIPGCKMNKSSRENQRFLSVDTTCTEMPVFVSYNSWIWLWIMSSLFVYTIDVTYRFIRRNEHANLLSFHLYKCDVISLKFLKPDFRANPGQYVFLQCPRISTFEWHPFSISQCPSSTDPTFTVHLRTTGDWTECLKEYLIEDNEEMLISTDAHEIRMSYLPSEQPSGKILVDGPYSSCFENVFQHSVSICIAGGIGLTPFASVLSYLRIDMENLTKIKRIHLLWIGREIEIFYCFAELLTEMFETVWQLNQPDKFEFLLYVTKIEICDTVLNTLQESFPVLKPRIQLGRPKWHHLFEQWSSIYKKSNIGIFCCGSKVLTDEIKTLSHCYNSRGCRFSYYHEEFS